MDLVVALQLDIANLESGDFELLTVEGAIKVTQGLHSIRVGHLPDVDLNSFCYQGMEVPDWSFLLNQGYDHLIAALEDNVHNVGVYMSTVKLFAKEENTSSIVLTLDSIPFIVLEINKRK